MGCSECGRADAADGRQGVEKSDIEVTAVEKFLTGRPNFFRFFHDDLLVGRSEGRQGEIGTRIGKLKNLGWADMCWLFG